MTAELNPPTQTTRKTPVIYIVKIDVSRETLDKIEGLELKVRKILGKKTHISHDKMIRLAMEFSRANDILTEWALDLPLPKEKKKNAKRKR